MKDGARALIDAIDAAEKNPALGPPVVTPAFVTDDEAANLFGLNSGARPALLLASVDRKTGGGSFVAFDGSGLTAGKAPNSATLKAMLGFVREHLPHSATPDALSSFAPAAAALPAFPKPPNVLAAEERAAKKAAAAGGIASVTSKASLDEKCYNLDGKVQGSSTYGTCNVM